MAIASFNRGTDAESQMPIANVLEALWNIPSSGKTSTAIFCCVTTVRGFDAKHQAWSYGIAARNGDEKRIEAYPLSEH